MSRYDIVVYGASGVTGQWVIEKLAKAVQEEKGSVTWAAAGRNKNKIQQSLAEAAKITGLSLTDIPIIEASNGDEESLRNMARQATVVINTVGPYTVHGEEVVRACIAQGTSHIDVTGEQLFMEKLEIEYNSAAKEKNVYVVSACGFDCIPADLGASYLAQQYKGDLNAVEVFVNQLRPEKSLPGPSFNVATLMSLVSLIQKRKEMEYVHSRLYPDELPMFKPKLKKRFFIHYNEEVKAWCFMVPLADNTVIQRSQRWFFENDKQRPVQSNVYLQLPSLIAAFVIIIGLLFYFIMSSFRFTSNLLQKYPGLFSFGFFGPNGPSRAKAETIRFEFVLVGTGWDDKMAEPTDQHQEKPRVKKTLRVLLTNPAYGATADMLVQSALVILKERDRLPQGGGVLTTAAAFSKTSLVERLRNHGVGWEMVRQD